MADGLVAELTIRMRNEMLGGIKQIQDEFAQLKESLGLLNAPLSDTEKLMAELTAPPALLQGLDAAVTDASELNELMTNLIGASSEAAQAMLGIGSAIDSDTAKMQALLTDMVQAQEDMAKLSTTPGSGAGSGSRSAGATGGGGDEGDADNGSSNGGQASPKKDKKHDDSGGDEFFAFGKGIFGKLMEGAMVAMAGLNAASDWSDYDNTARQITVTEHLSPKQSATEDPRLKLWADNLATQYANSSKGILEAYSFLITDSLTKAQVEGILPGLTEASTAYNVPIGDVVQAAFSVQKNLGVPVAQVPDAMAVLHHAAMMGHFGMEDLSTYLPGIGGQMSVFGMHGLPGEITGASALEIIRRNTGDAGEADTQLKELIDYLHSPTAMRMFDRTTKMNDLLGAAGRELLDKYKVKPLNLPEYLNDEEAKGIDPINAMADYFADITKNIKSPTDKGFVIGAFLHDQTAQKAMIALTQYHQDFLDYQQRLAHVSDATLTQDYDVATEGGTVNYKKFEEDVSQDWRGVGGFSNDILGDVNSILEFQYGWDHLLGLNNGYGPNNGGFGPGLGEDSLSAQEEAIDYAKANAKASNQAPLQITPQIPITVNVHIDKNQNVAVTGGVTGGAITTPGTNVRVNQGNVLTGVH